MMKNCELNLSGLSLDGLIDSVCKEFAINRYDIGKKDRDNDLSTARPLICYWGMTKLGITTTCLAGRLSISQSTISKISKKGAGILRTKQLVN